MPERRPRAHKSYLNELIDFGGEWCTRAQAILYMQSIGATQSMIDRWLQGNDLAQQRRERASAISVRVFLDSRLT